MRHLAYSLALWLFSTALAVGQSADTIYYNGHGITVWDVHPVVEALAIRGDTILAVGSNQALPRPATKKVDWHGRTVMPGLIESRVHPVRAAPGDRDEQGDVGTCYVSRLMVGSRRSEPKGGGHLWTSSGKRKESS